MDKDQPVMATQESVILGCPICGSFEKWPLQYHRDFTIWGVTIPVEPQYGWWLCRTCGNGYPSFLPDLKALASLWENNRDISEADRSRQAAVWECRKKISEKGAQRSYKFFAPLQVKKSGRFLDIGCGLGETVKLFAEHGWEAMGVDADPNMRPIHEAIGIKSEISQIETLDLTQDFDIIHSAHAIYFITNPRFFLEKLKPRLKAGGILCIILSDFMSSNNPGFPGYAHSFFPTAGSMRYLLALAGYETILSRTFSGSIYLAAKPADVTRPLVHPRLIRLGYQTKRLRYALLGRPHLTLRRWVKAMLAGIR